MKIERIREASKRYVSRREEGSEFSNQNYQLKKNEISEVAKDFRARYKSIPPVKDTDGFDDEEFYGLRVDFEQIRNA